MGAGAGAGAAGAGAYRDMTGGARGVLSEVGGYNAFNSSVVSGGGGGGAGGRGAKTLVRLCGSTRGLTAIGFSDRS